MKMQLFAIALFSASTALVAAPAHAQSPRDWSGFYGGFQLGRLDAQGRAALNGIEGDNETYGVHAGYNRDLGDWVLGAEVDYDSGDVRLNRTGARAGEIDSVARLKLRAGYDLGQALVYATGGAARAETSIGNDTSDFYGVGLAYEISNRFVVSGEILSHDFSNIGGISGNDVGAETLSLRFSLRF
jgi:predicted porin